MGFFVTGKRGTIRGPLRCNAVDACLKLYQGMRGIGTDEKAITAVVSSHTSKQRQQIRKKYSQVYKKDLLKELDGELSFAFGTLVLALMADPEDFTLECIYRAVVHQRRGGNIVKRLSALFKDGLSKTEYSILSLLCPRSNKELEEIKTAFKAKYDLDIEERIALGGNDLPQDLCTLLLDMLSGERQEEDEVDHQLVEEDADSLLGGGNEDMFQEMMQERSFEHLRCVFDQYAVLTGKEIDAFVEESDAFSVELKEAYKGIILLLRNQPEFYAMRLKQAIQGAGTDDETLIRIIVLRSEVDLLDIMQVYENKFGKTLADDVAGDTSGDYKDILMRIIAVPPPGSDERKVTARKATTKTVKDQEEQVKPQAKAETRQRKSKRDKLPPAMDTEEELQEEQEAVEEAVVERKQKKMASRAKAAATSARKKLSLPEQDEDAGQSDVEQETEEYKKPKTVAKGKKTIARSVERSPTSEEEEAEEEEEEEVVVVQVKPQKRLAKKVVAAKKQVPPPEEEQSGMEEEEVQTEEEVEVKKVSRRAKPIKKQAAAEEKDDDEVLVVEELAESKIVSEENEGMRAASPEEASSAEFQVEEDEREKEESVDRHADETPEVVVMLEADNEDEEGTANAKTGEDVKVEGSVSPIISREL